MLRRQETWFGCSAAVCGLLALAGGLRAAEPATAEPATNQQRAGAVMPPVLESAETEASTTAERCDDLLKSGRFQDFVAATAELPADATQLPAVARLRVEACLAVGQNRAAEQAAQRALKECGDPASTPDASLLKLWLTARWRQGRGLAELPLASGSRAGGDLAESAPPAALRFWHTALAGADPYRLAPRSRSAVLPMRARAPASPPGSAASAASSELPAIALDVNGVRLARAFVDTGAQHTVLTPAAAAAAGVELGPDGVGLVGFSSFPARPAVVRRLRLGTVVLQDIPVYVGDSPALAQAGGQASLGIDVLYHLRLVMDYPRQQVVVAPAGNLTDTRVPVDTGATGTLASSATRWEIPLWTFSHVCLAQGRMADGSIARTLIDTGNGQGTYLSSRWASRQLPDFQPFKNWFLLRHRLGKYALARWELGSEELSNWPVRGTLPDALERLDLVDLLVGHDLLAGYSVEIDLAGRRLRLTPTRP